MISTEQVIGHFTSRAPDYDRSSAWCTDQALLARLRKLLAPRPSDHLLDVACGTGLVAAALRPHVHRVVGVDITPDMLKRAAGVLDEAVLCNAELLPFADATFDLAVCRQGIQFLNAPRAVAEMVRTVRPGGQVCLVNLCAYGPQDCQEFFEILRLRNPVRRNFFLREDLLRLLAEAGCRQVALHDHVSREDINVWTERAAIGPASLEGIRELYLRASPAFRRLHQVELTAAGRIQDAMLFGIAIGTV